MREGLKDTIMRILKNAHLTTEEKIETLEELIDDVCDEEGGKEGNY